MEQKTPEVWVMASGTNTGGGSGAANLVRRSRGRNALSYKVAGFICDRRDGGVEHRAHQLGVPFIYFPGELVGGQRVWDAAQCYELIGAPDPRIAMSGWLRVGRGYHPQYTCNIHPGPTWALSSGERPFAGWGMYGKLVHEKVLSWAKMQLISHTEVTMHAVTDEPDAGVVMARIPVPIYNNDNVDRLAARVNRAEHLWQPLVIAEWVNGLIEVAHDGSWVKTRFPH